MEIPEQTPGLDLRAALARVGGDGELLKEIAAIFLEEWRSALAAVDRAVAAGDADGLQEAAHSIKGSIANFGAQEAFDAALRLEMMGRNRALTGSREALSQLERSLQNLVPQLTRLAGG